MVQVNASVTVVDTPLAFLNSNVFICPKIGLVRSQINQML